MTAVISIVDAAVAVQQAFDVNARMASGPSDTNAWLPSSVAGVASTAKCFDFQSVLERLDGFMKVADLAAEVCRYCATVFRRWN
jgi:hypothetical protein